MEFWINILYYLLCCTGAYSLIGNLNIISQYVYGLLTNIANKVAVIEDSMIKRAVKSFGIHLALMKDTALRISERKKREDRFHHLESNLPFISTVTPAYDEANAHFFVVSKAVSRYIPESQKNFGLGRNRACVIVQA